MKILTTYTGLFFSLMIVVACGSSSNSGVPSKKSEGKCGTYCVTNKSDCKIELWVNDRYSGGYRSITIQPKETGCFYELPIGVVSVEFKKAGLGLDFGSSIREVQFKKCSTIKYTYTGR